MPLIETPGAADANSFLTLVEANNLIAAHPVHTQWDLKTDPQKEAFAQQATRTINASFVWTGAATLPETQALTWPRTGMLNRNGYALDPMVIPNDLKAATAELMRQSAETGDTTGDNDAVRQGIQRVKAASVEIEYQKRAAQTPDQIAAELELRGSAYYYLWSAIPDAVRNLLVPSWYVAALPSDNGYEFQVY